MVKMTLQEAQEIFMQKYWDDKECESSPITGVGLGDGCLMVFILEETKGLPEVFEGFSVRYRVTG